MASTSFRGMHPFSQFMFTLFVMAVTVIFITVIGIIVSIPFFGFGNILKYMSPTGFNSPESINFLKYFQILQSVGLFVIPPIVLGLLFHGKTTEYLYVNQKARWQSFLIVIICLLVAIPLINFLGNINSQMKFPQFLSGIEKKFKDWEEIAKLATERFLDVKSIFGLLINIFIMAVIPAFGEELLFRGIIQRIFSNWTKNHHWGIWITAFLFSAMHMQFYGFLPRMALGAMFGYLLVWTGTIWVPILAHFVNNAMSILGYYFINKGAISNDIEEWGTGTEQLPLVVFSILAVGSLLFLIYRGEQAKTKMPVNQADSQASRID